MGAAESVPQKSIHEFTVKDYKGKDVDLSIYKGKDRGLVILAFLCNQFLKQKPSTGQEVQEFACTTYKANYLFFQKVRVNGTNAAPVYKFLKASKNGFLGSRKKWNFTKFLVDKEGQVLHRYGPTTAPLSFEAEIKKALEVE
ncbi:hypothetical protein SLE2022_168150 [Rubroshorea leprosula]